MYTTVVNDLFTAFNSTIQKKFEMFQKKYSLTLQKKLLKHELKKLLENDVQIPNCLAHSFFNTGQFLIDDWMSNTNISNP